MQERIKGIIRLLVALVPVVNLILIQYDLSPLPFTQEEVNAGLSAAVSVLGILWAWWKNNNITNAAQAVQPILDKFKADKNKVGGEK